MGRLSRIGKRQGRKKKRKGRLQVEEGSLAHLLLQSIEERPGIKEEALIALVRDTPAQLYDGPRDEAAVVACLADLRKRGIFKQGPG